MVKTNKVKRSSPLYSKAVRKVWSKVDPEERSRRMSELAKLKWSKIPKKKRTLLARKIAKARYSK